MLAMLVINADMTKEELTRVIERLTERMKKLELGLEAMESRFWDTERDIRYLETDVAYLKDELLDHEHN